MKLFLAKVTVYRRGKKTRHQIQVITRSSIEAGLSALNLFVLPGDQFKLKIKPVH